MSCFLSRVLQAEKEIVDAEGVFYVAGRYFADVTSSDKARRLEAERRVRAADRAALARTLVTLTERWEITEAGRAVLAATPALPCLIGHDGVCRAHDEPCARIKGEWVCLVSRMAA
jgi:hypothetical protein